MRDKDRPCTAINRQQPAQLRQKKPETIEASAKGTRLKVQRPA